MPERLADEERVAVREVVEVAADRAALVVEIATTDRAEQLADGVDAELAERDAHEALGAQPRPASRSASPWTSLALEPRLVSRIPSGVPLGPEHAR